MHNNFILRLAENKDAARIWQILQQAIRRRGEEGSRQWQDGYPNEDTVKSDIATQQGFVMEDSESNVLAYAALIKNYEPAYENIEGAWLSDGDFLVVHRVAVADEAAGKGVATQLFEEIERYAVNAQLPSIKVDTNFDNLAMLRILQKLGYNYCGEVQLRGAPRKAFEKLLFTTDVVK